MEKELEGKINRSLNCLEKLIDNPFTLQKIVYWLYGYNNLYAKVRNYSENICKQCQEWEELGLPYDCLQNPDYCMRKPIYFEFINTYEEIQKRITTLQN